MKIFITGIAGFLGANLADYYLKKNFKVSGCDNLIGGSLENIDTKKINFFKANCEDLDEMSKIIKDVDVLVHTAAYPHEGLSSFSPYLICKSNYIGSVSVFTAAIQNNVKRIVFCSSMARYGNQKSPFTEDMTPKPVDPYGIAKVAVEDTLKLLCEVHSMDYNIAVPHNIVGPNQKYDDPFRNVMSIFINRNLQNKPSIIYGDGNQKRCFSYIDDVIFCLEKLALDKKINKEIINIGPDEETITVNELAKIVANETGYNGKPLYVSGRPQEVLEASCSSDKARKLLEYKTKTSLRNSVKLTADYIRKKGTKEFIYNLPVEIKTNKTPETWIKKTI